MVKLIDKTTKISFLDYLYMFFIIIYAAKGSAFVRGLGDPFSLGNTVAVIFTLIMIFVHRVRISNSYLLSISILVLYTILTFIAHNYMSIGFIPRWFIYLSIAYVICQIYGEKIFIVIESVFFPLFIISMVFWVFHLLNPSAIHALVERFSLPTFSKSNNYVTYNCVFYTINGEEDMLLGDYYFFRRNAGFAWEPGAYSCFACLAIACNWIRNPKLLINAHVLVYLAAIATSQSTTGVFILSCILLAWIIANKKYYLTIVLIPLVLYVFRLSFVSDKFSDELMDISTSNSLTTAGYHGRIYGLVASWYEFIQHPIIGLGGKQDMYLKSMNIDAPIFSGIGSLFTTFGLVLSVVFFVLLFRSQKYVRVLFNNYGGFYIIVVIIISMFSYHLWETPLFLSLAFLSIYSTFFKQVQINTMNK